jgi:hypothetical protein
MTKKFKWFIAACAVLALLNAENTQRLAEVRNELWVPHADPGNRKLSLNN